MFIWYSVYPIYLFLGFTSVLNPNLHFFSAPCGDFNGNSYLDMKFDPEVYGTKRIREEKLLLTFQTKAKRKQVLLDIYNSE